MAQSRKAIEQSLMIGTPFDGLQHDTLPHKIHKPTAQNPSKGLRPSKQKAELSLNTIEPKASRPIASLAKVSEIDKQRRAENLHQHAPGPDADPAHEDSFVPDSPEVTKIGVCQDNRNTYGAFSPLINAAKFEFSSKAAKFGKLQEQRKTNPGKDGGSKQNVSNDKTSNAGTSNLPDISKKDPKDPWELLSDDEGGKHVENKKSADVQMLASYIIPDSDLSQRSEKPSTSFQKQRKSNVNQDSKASMPEQRAATRLDRTDEQAKGSADPHYGVCSPDKAAKNVSRGTERSQNLNKGGVAKRKLDKNDTKAVPTSKRKSANSIKLSIDKHANKELEHKAVISDSGSDGDFLPIKKHKSGEKKRLSRVKKLATPDLEDESMPEELNDFCITQQANTNNISGDVPVSRDSPEPATPSCIGRISFCQICHSTHNIHSLRQSR